MTLIQEQLYAVEITGPKGRKYLAQTDEGAAPMLFRQRRNAAAHARELTEEGLVTETVKVLLSIAKKKT